MSIDSARAQWLRAPIRQAVATDAAIEARWGELALDNSQASALVDEADAVAEAARQLAQFGAARARDTVVVTGLHPSLAGRTVRIAYAGRLGMGATADLLVVRSRVRTADGLTELEGEVQL